MFLRRYQNGWNGQGRFDGFSARICRLASPCLTISHFGGRSPVLAGDPAEEGRWPARPRPILFLHGWHSVPGGIKPTYLADHGHEVINPALHDDDFDEAVRVAQAENDRHHPDVIVGSSRGGAVAMNLHSGSTPLVLLCPAWKRWGTNSTVKPGTVILHSEADDVIPINESRELVRASGLPESALLVVGNDHRLADPGPLKVMLETCEGAILRRKPGDNREE